MAGELSIGLRALCRLAPPLTTEMQDLFLARLHGEPNAMRAWLVADIAGDPGCDRRIAPEDERPGVAGDLPAESLVWVVVDLGVACVYLGPAD